jgi:hypothetical protein
LEKKNPIYLFYEIIQKNAEGVLGKPGDKHYKCYHGSWKVLTITRAMRSSLNSNCNSVGNPDYFRSCRALKDTFSGYALSISDFQGLR